MLTVLAIIGGFIVFLLVLIACFLAALYNDVKFK